MTRLSKQAIVLVALGLAAWLLVSGIVLLDVLSGTTAPTARPVVIRATDVPTATAIPISTSTATPVPPAAFAVIPTLPSTTPTATPTADDPGSTDEPPAVIATEAVSPPGDCPARPAGWVAYTVESGDTLFGFELGSKGKANVAAILVGNCLTSKLLAIGQVIYLPPGAADNAPKIDDGPAGSVSLATGPSRTPRCPCQIVVREGWRLEQIAAAVDQTPVGFSGRDFMAAAGPGAPIPDLGFLKSHPAGKSLEGFMFPGTYNLENSTSAVQFRDMLLNAFAANVSGQIQADAAARGYSFWQVIVLASIVQRESHSPNEQKLIASVFYNRLAASKGIAATVTLQYALGRAGNWWPRVVGSMINTDSPYNTNIYAGLPPSPIASPGLGAILAAVYAPKTDYQFFSAKCGGGGNFYTVTYEEFKKGLQCGP
jgi:cell division protein YceG involved in septum cleavage